MNEVRLRIGTPLIREALPVISIKNVKNLEGAVQDITIPSSQLYSLDAEKRLTLLPALFDPHVHFHAEWGPEAKKAIIGGVATVSDIPDPSEKRIDKERLDQQSMRIAKSLAEIKIPLHFHLYIEADLRQFELLNLAKPDTPGIIIDIKALSELSEPVDNILDNIFRIAAQKDMIVIFNAASNDENQHNNIQRIQKVISYTEKYSAQLCILHVSSLQEIELIRQAKKASILVYAETTAQQLFLTEDDRRKWGKKLPEGLVICSKANQDALWEGIQEGVIDFIGSGHRSETISTISATLPLLLNAYHEKKITLEKIVALTSRNAAAIFQLDLEGDAILVDLEEQREVQEDKSALSPFAGRLLKGWPSYTILRGQIFKGAF